MSDPTKEAPLSGESSIFPYGLDEFRFERNYESSNVEEQGDVITASLRNHIADAVLNTEAELLSVSNGYAGDALISCMTLKVTSWGFLSTYAVPLPADTKSFIIGDDVNETLESTRLPVVLQVGLRPLTQLGMWDSDVYPGAMHYVAYVKGNTVNVTIKDPQNYIWNTSERQASGHLGDFIISIILFRQR